MFGAAALQARAQLRLTLGPGEEPFSQCAQIESGPAGHDGQMAARGNLRERRTRLPAVFTSGKGLIWIGYVDQMMRQTRAFSGSGLCRTQIHAAIDGHRVATDDLAAEALAQFKRQRRFAAARGAKQQNG
jgi:hypothetical protein